MNKIVYICDLDGTICDNSHRLHRITGKVRDYELYHSECHEDKPISPVITVIQALMNCTLPNDAVVEMLYLTGRPDKTRLAATRWLADNFVPNGMMLMRDDNDRRPAKDVKCDLLERFTRAYTGVIAGVFEDDPECVRMYREKGLTVFQVGDRKEGKENG